MSFLDDLDSRKIVRFPGASQRLDELHLTSGSPTAGALLARNCEFDSGMVTTRNGFGQALALNRIVKAAYNWRPGSANYLIYLHDVGASDTVIAYNLGSGGVGSELYTLATGLPSDSAIFADGGTRIYFAFHDANGWGATQGYVWDGNASNGIPHMEKLFQRPLLTTEFSISAAGVSLLPGEIGLTSGIHKLAAVFVTKNAYETGLSPIDTASTLIPFTLTVPGTSGIASQQAYTITLTPTSTWPTWCWRVYIALTTVNNLERYYLVPAGGGWSTTPGNVPTPGSSSPVTVRIAISDSELASGANSRSVDNLRTQFQQDSSGNGPFNPSWVAAGTNRMAYGTALPDATLNVQSAIYVSDPLNYQRISADQHKLSLPGGRRCVTGGWEGRTLYLFGPSWTYAQSDNGQVPAQWPPIRTLDEKIGTRWPRGVTLNSSKNWWWVAHESGLYLLRGQAYDPYPISFDQGAADWDRINFGASAGALKVFENVKTKQIFVAAPLDGSDFATHLLVWDYSEGETYRGVKYSLWDLRDSGGLAYRIGAVAQARSVAGISSVRDEMWIGRAETAGSMLRQRYSPVDAADVLYTDDGAAIDSQYHTPPVVWDDDVRDFAGIKLRATGVGDLNISAFGADQQSEAVAAPVTLSTTPGNIWVRLFRLNSHACSVKFTNGNSVGAWFRVSMVDVRSKRLWEYLIA